MYYYNWFLKISYLGSHLPKLKCYYWKIKSILNYVPRWIHVLIISVFLTHHTGHHQIIPTYWLIPTPLLDLVWWSIKKKSIFVQQSDLSRYLSFFSSQTALLAWPELWTHLVEKGKTAKKENELFIRHSTTSQSGWCQRASQEKLGVIDMFVTFAVFGAVYVWMTVGIFSVR